MQPSNPKKKFQWSRISERGGSGRSVRPHGAVAQATSPLRSRPSSPGRRRGWCQACCQCLRAAVRQETMELHRGHRKGEGRIRTCRHCRLVLYVWYTTEVFVCVPKSCASKLKQSPVNVDVPFCLMLDRSSK